MRPLAMISFVFCVPQPVQGRKTIPDLLSYGFYSVLEFLLLLPRSLPNISLFLGKPRLKNVRKKPLC